MLYRKLYSSLVVLLALASPAAANHFADFFPGLYKQLPAEMRHQLDKLELEQGLITIGDGIAELNVPENYYYLNPEATQFVLEDLWGNPDGSGSLGMIFPSNTTPLHSDSWGIEITYDQLGYVEDKDATDYDFDALLEILKEETEGENEWRVENGYQSIDLVGWAAEPTYNPQTRELYWAKRLRFEGEDQDTLNYNIRELGREGVLVVNFIATIDQLHEIEAAVPEVLAMVSFSDGYRYSDFNPDVDKVAAVGIGGLIAGKVLLSNPGILAWIVGMVKQFGFLVFVILMSIKNQIVRRREKNREKLSPTSS